MATDIGTSYIRASTQENLIETVKQLPPAGYGDTPVNLGWIFAILSGLFVVAECIPRRNDWRI